MTAFWTEKGVTTFHQGQVILQDETIITLQTNRNLIAVFYHFFYSYLVSLTLFEKIYNSSLKWHNINVILLTVSFKLIWASLIFPIKHAVQKWWAQPIMKGSFCVILHC